MLLARQRLLLALLDAIGRPVRHLEFQKLLFLYAQECETVPSYEFVPYKYGPFSFTSYADKRKLIAAGLLVDDDHHWALTEAGRATAGRLALGLAQVAYFCRDRGLLRGDALVAEVYRRSPWHATRSEILDQVALDPETRARIEAAKPRRGPAGLVTIGYEGRSLENYLNVLLQAGVTLLCDVRRNPVSRKYGFSKGTLNKACEGVGLRYAHLPELGIASEQRRGLRTKADYGDLFARYERQTLPSQRAALDTIRGWVAAGERVALTCLERRPEQCHRHCVAAALERLDGPRLRAQHL